MGPKQKLYIPSYFYYPKEEEGTSLTEHPTGEPSAQALAQGHKKFWVDRCPVVVQSKKILILNDWSLASWEFPQKKQILEQLLTEEGFEIWIWLSNKLFRLTPQMLNSVNFWDFGASYIFAAPRETLLKSAKEENLSPETLVFLDNFQFEQLRTPSPLKYFIKLSALERRKDQLDITIRIIKSYYEEIVFVVDEYSHSMTLFLQQNLSKLQQEGTLINGQGEDYSKITSISLANQPLTSEDLNNLLSLTPLLQKLDLAGHTGFESDFSLAGISLANLVDLNLPNSNISEENLQAFLLACPQLRKLNLTSCKKLGSHFSLNEIPLPKLQNIRLMDSSISEENLLAFLLACPQLQTLNLTSCKVLGNNFSLKGIPVSNLQRLGLADISEENLQTFLVACPQLTKLTLVKYKTLGSDFSLMGVSLPKLLELQISGSSLSKKNLQSLLLTCPKLTIFNLISCKSLPGTLSLEPGSLEDLIILNLIGSNISPTTLQNFLQACPKLQTLKLSSDYRLRTFLSLENNTYNRVKKLFISQETPLDILEGLQRVFPQAKIAYNNDFYTSKAHKNISPFNINKYYTLKSPEKPFIYDTCHNQNLSQRMVINQLSQYLHLYYPHREALIKKMQTGICAALSGLYLEDMERWCRNLKTIRTWTGEKDSLSAGQKNILNAIFKKVDSIYGDNRTPSEITFLGNALKNFLEKNPSKYILSNINHAIAVSYDNQNNNWRVFNPSFPDGYKVVAKKDLINTIHYNLGKLINVYANVHIPIEKAILDKNRFLSQGGFLLLSRSSFKKFLYAFLKDFHSANVFTKNALRGLFLRSWQKKAKPAWLLGINTPHCKEFFISCIVYALEEKFFSLEDFKKSLSALPEKEHDTQIKLLGEVLKPYLNKKNNIIFSLMEESQETFINLEEVLNPYSSRNEDKISSLMKEYQKDFTSSQTTPYKDESILQAKDSSFLVKTYSSEGNIACLLRLIHSAKESNTPYFVVSSPEDLNCSSWIKREGDRGALQTSGGPLQTFLTSGARGILIIDYSTFTDAEIRRATNSLLDNTRKTGDLSVPDGIKIIGIHNVEDKTHSQGEDFYSRFSKHIPYKEDPQEILQPILVNENYPIEEENTLVINLYEGADWEERLRGSLRLQGKHFIYEEDVLLNALKTRKKIVIANPPKNNYAYNRYIQRLLNEEELEGVHFSKKDFSFHTGYDWVSLSKLITFENVGAQHFYNAHSDSSPYLLTPQSFQQLLTHSYCDKRGRYYQGKGLLETRMLDAGKPFPLLLAGPLNKHQWAELLEHAKKLGITLQCSVLPNISIPEELASLKPCAMQTEELPSCSPSEESIGQKRKRPPENTDEENTSKKPRLVTHSSFVYSTDPDVTAKQLQEKESNTFVINITDLGSTDLIQTLNLAQDSTLDDLRFEEKTLFLLKALEKDDKTSFILTGHFKPSLFNALLPLIQQYPHRITLISQEEKRFSAFAPKPCHVSFEERKECLSPEEKNLIASFRQETLASFSYAELRALAAFQKNHPENKNPRKPWEGYNKTAPFNPKNFIFNSITAPQDVEAFKQKRLDLVENVLKTSPFVFIGGATGVGKSAFIKFFEKQHPNSVYYGEKALENWARNKKGGYLFLDEANITRGNWSEFEGLFQRPPYIIIQGTKYPLSENHKVIFAGNPLNYGGSRHQPEFFQRHGNSILFAPLPSNVVYEEILKPILENSPLNVHQEEISETLLKAYQFLVELSKESLLVTPRQLKSVLMLSLAEYMTYLEESCIPKELELSTVKQILRKNIHRVLRPLVPELHKNRFDKEFFLMPMIRKKTYPMADISVTSSRQDHVEILRSFLRLRDFKQKFSSALNDSQLFGDICSVVLEGMPALGKTDFLQALMKESNIAEADYLSAEPQTNVYYNIPVNLSFEEKERRLRKAFSEGNIVIMDEMNSCPTMEALVNALLSGETPEGERPEKPGFLLLGTQNPVSMGGGRQRQTQAEDMRTLKLYFEEYPVEELCDILSEKGLKDYEAIALARVFTHAREQWLPDNEKNPHQENAPPNLRLMLRKAEDIVEKNRSMTYNTAAMRGIHAYGFNLGSSSSTTPLNPEQTAQPRPVSTMSSST